MFKRKDSSKLFRNTLVPTSIVRVSKSRLTGWHFCRPATIVGQILGLLPWDIRNSLQKKPRSNSAFYLCNLYRIAAAICCFALPLSQISPVALRQVLHEFNNENASLSSLVNSSYDFALAPFSVLMFLSYIAIGRRFVDLLQTWGASDELMRKKSVKNTLYLKLVLSYLVPPLVFASMELAYDGYTVGQAFTYSISTVIGLGINLHPTIFYITTSDLCSIYFESLSEELLHTLKLPKDEFNKRILAIRNHYDTLYRNVSNIQSSFGFLITATLAQHTVFICLMPFNIVFHGGKNAWLVYNIVYLLHCGIQLWNIVMATITLTEKARQGLDYLHDNKNHQLTENGRFQILMLADKLSSRPVEISACGFFLINKGIITTILSISVTYFVILQQFNPDAAKKDSTISQKILCNCSNGTLI